MPKPSRGGRRTPVTNPVTIPGGGGGVGPAAPIPPQNTQPAAQQDQDDNVFDTDESGQENKNFNDFRKMTDDEKADVINQALNNGAPPSFLPDNPSQRLLWQLQGDNHPTIVSDQQLDGMKGKDLYRQVGAVHDATLGTNLTSAQIANQVMTGDLTQYATSWGSATGGGGTAYGRAIYFGTSYSEIQNYYGTGRAKAGVQDSTLFRCKIGPGAKGMGYSALQRAAQKEMASGSKLGRALQKVQRMDTKGDGDATTVYALAKGIDYSYDDSGWSSGYHMIYNRGCLYMSSRTKHNANDTKW